ncbi:hypothetical protein ACNVED_01780 [Legionella sp. D16C41]|uniref:hypothetical protein n=1 Tax=Legionella sp. D16C41 TaxID=3402688 RepID=UPI003AF8241A
MYLGPFWCEERKHWLRFNIQKSGQCVAEIAWATETGVCSAWVAVESGFWIVNAQLNLKQSFLQGIAVEDYSLKEVKQGFYLKNGILYRTNWNRSPYLNPDQFEISQLIADINFKRISPDRLENNPFVGPNPKTSTLSSEKLLPKLPRTPEMQAIQQKQWQAWQKSSIRATLVNNINLISELPELNEKLKSLHNAESILYSYGEANLFEMLNPELFSDVYSYLATLETVTDERSPLYQLLKSIAAETAFDRETNINPNNSNAEIRKYLYKSKLSYLLNLIVAERETLLKFFHLPITPLIYSLPVMPSQSIQFHENEVISSSNPLSIKPVHEEQLVIDKAILSAIKQATIKAVNNYRDWYFSEDKSQVRKGLFSRLRHGLKGQQRALELNDEIQRTTNSADAILSILNFLYHPKCRYQRHSFSTFLLEELQKIPNENLPWNDPVADFENNESSRFYCC